MLMHPFCVHARAFRVPAVLVTLLLAVSTAGVVGVAGPAGAAPTVATRFHMTGSSIAVAVANGRVFDATADGVVEVFDMAGHLLTSVADEPSAMVMTASSDGSKVFVSLYNSNAVSVIDATTLSEVARYDTSAVGEPGDLVQVDSNLFLTTSNGNVGVIDLTSTASAATRLASAGGLLGGFTARATATPGSDDIYISSCLANISVCNLYRYRYDGSTATLASEVDNVAGRGPVAFDAADNVILAADSPSRDRINVLDPNTLATIWTIAGSAGSSGLLLVGGRIVSGAYDYARNTYATVEVRDLSGALLFSQPTLGRGIYPVASPGVNAVYAVDAVNAADNGFDFVTLPDSSLLKPSTPKPTTGVTATAQAGGKIKLSWTASVVDANNAPTAYEIYRGTASGWMPPLTIVPASQTSFTDAGLTNGATYYYAVSASNAAGGPTQAQLVSAIADASAPTVKLTSPAAYTLSNQISVSYGGSDLTSGIAHFDLRYRSAAWNGNMSGYTYPATWQNRPSAGALTLAGSAGHEYCISVRATDKAGNVSAWSTDRCTVVPVDDRSLSALTAGWTRAIATSAYLSTSTNTTTLGAQLRLANVRTKQIALVVTTCSRCGTLGIYLNGSYWRSVNTYSPTTKARAVVVLPAFSLRTTTVTFKVLTAGRQTIVDGLAITNS
ncbi:MAG: trimeric autotransporter adhesin [Pseudonocardiales bacterium]|jgi:hypothetical protein|nr:trimeric autotransporter adhesin [Pseudonocardiales bacterium]